MTEQSDTPEPFYAIISAPHKAAVGLTKIPGVIDKRDVRPGMAHFANTGPVGTICFDCAFFTGDHKYHKGRCRKFADLIAGQQRGGAASPRNPDVRPAFNANTASCRYFEPKPAANNSVSVA